MILFGVQVSPFVRKTLIAAAEKGIAFEHRPVRPHTDDAEFKAASPFGKVPALQDGDFRLCDSTAILTYFEAIRPTPALLPAEPRARARAIWFEEFADTIMFPAGTKIFFNRIVLPKMAGQPGDLALADAAAAREVPPLLDYLERVVPAPDGFLAGGAYSVGDIAVASQLINLMHADCPVDAGRYPRTAAWFDAQLRRPSVARLVAAERAMLGA